MAPELERGRRVAAQLLVVQLEELVERDLGTRELREVAPGEALARELRACVGRIHRDRGAM